MSDETRTFDQLLIAAHRQLRQVLLERGDPAKHAFVVSRREALVIKDQLPFHQHSMNPERSTICGMPIQVQP